MAHIASSGGLLRISELWAEIRDRLTASTRLESILGGPGRVYLGADAPSRGFEVYAGPEIRVLILVPPNLQPEDDSRLRRTVVFAIRAEHNGYSTEAYLPQIRLEAALDEVVRQLDGWQPLGLSNVLPSAPIRLTDRGAPVSLWDETRGAWYVESVFRAEIIQPTPGIPNVSNPDAFVHIVDPLVGDHTTSIVKAVRGPDGTLGGAAGAPKPLLEDGYWKTSGQLRRFIEYGDVMNDVFMGAEGWTWIAAVDIPDPAVDATASHADLFTKTRLFTTTQWGTWNYIAIFPSRQEYVLTTSCSYDGQSSRGENTSLQRTVAATGHTKGKRTVLVSYDPTLPHGLRGRVGFDGVIPPDDGILPPLSPFPENRLAHHGNIVPPGELNTIGKSFIVGGKENFNSCNGYGWHGLYRGILPAEDFGHIHSWIRHRGWV